MIIRSIFFVHDKRTLAHYRQHYHFFAYAYAYVEWMVCNDGETITNTNATNIDGKILHFEINLHKLIEISKSDQ